MQPLWKGVWRFLRTLRVELLYKCTNFTAGYSSEENENTNSKDTCIPMFKVALFIIAKIWKKPMCLSRDNWKRCEIYIHAFTHRNTHKHTHKYIHSAKKKKKWNSASCNNMYGHREYYAKWNKSEKDKYCMISLIRGI